MLCRIFDIFAVVQFKPVHHEPLRVFNDKLAAGVFHQTQSGRKFDGVSVRLTPCAQILHDLCPLCLSLLFQFVHRLLCFVVRFLLFFLPPPEECGVQYATTARSEKDFFAYPVFRSTPDAVFHGSSKVKIFFCNHHGDLLTFLDIFVSWCPEGMAVRRTRVSKTCN